jgi:hypothetical protein
VSNRNQSLNSRDKSMRGWGYSLHAGRDPESDVGRFMRDAAFANVVMARENNPLQSITNRKRTPDGTSQ